MSKRKRKAPGRQDQAVAAGAKRCGRGGRSRPRRCAAAGDCRDYDVEPLPKR